MGTTVVENIMKWPVHTFTHNKCLHLRKEQQNRFSRTTGKLNKRGSDTLYLLIHTNLWQLQTC